MPLASPRDSSEKSPCATCIPDLTRYDGWAYGLFAAPVRSFQPRAIQIQKETIVLMEEMLGESLILRRSNSGEPVAAPYPLPACPPQRPAHGWRSHPPHNGHADRDPSEAVVLPRGIPSSLFRMVASDRASGPKIGRASCRERV